ncbi:MAG: hypothetical protein NTY19_24035 [Planctomycetota bacterium]|nr:hypothetical protein [Planctomycetota bacterium]
MTLEGFARLKAMGLRHIAERTAAAAASAGVTIGPDINRNETARVQDDVATTED